MILVCGGTGELGGRILGGLLEAGAQAADPPRMVEFGGPDLLTRDQAVDVFEHVLREPIRRRHIPRAAIKLGAVGLRRPRPAMASIMGGALAADLHPAT